jgi:hypothetical protein
MCPSGAAARVPPHLHVVALDGCYVAGRDEQPVFHPLPHLKSDEVADVLQMAKARILKALARLGAVDVTPDALAVDDAWAARDPVMAHLAAAAVAGLPPAGPAERKCDPVTIVDGGRPDIVGDLVVQDHGFNLHAKTRAGALDEPARARLLRYVLRPPLARERLERLPDHRVRLQLKRPWSDGTYALEMDALALLSRLAASAAARHPLLKPGHAADCLLGPGLAPLAARYRDADHVCQSRDKTAERIEQPAMQPCARLHRCHRARPYKVVLDPRLGLCHEVAVGNLHQRLQIGERKWVKVETADEQATSIDGCDLGMQDRSVPFTDDDARAQEPTVKTSGGSASERHVAPACQQQVNFDAAAGGGGDGVDDASVGQKVAMGDVDALARDGEGFQVTATQPPPST